MVAPHQHRDVVEWVQQGWAAELPEVGTDSVAIVTRIWQLSKMLLDDRNRRLAALGMDAATLDLVSVLRRSGPPYVLTSGQIAQRTLVSAGAISQRVARAEALGLVARSRHQTDARVVEVRLTDQGRAEGERVARAVLTAENELLRDLGAEQRSDLASQLTALHAYLETRLAGSWSIL